MNAFYEHHKDSIRFGYRCFDRILLNGLIQPFQQPERVVGFFSTYRHLHPVSRDILRGAAEQFQLWVKEQADKWNAPIVEAPKGRRDEFVDPYFKGAGPDQVIVILKAREPARIMTAIGDKKLNRWHLQIADRWIVQYNFYISPRYALGAKGFRIDHLREHARLGVGRSGSSPWITRRGTRTRRGTHRSRPRTPRPAARRSIGRPRGR